jgi:hypothetical protein
MTKASRQLRSRVPSDQHREAACPPPATVASLGVQARLVPADPGREHKVACLIARYEQVCRDWDCLVQQALVLLGPEVQPDQSGARSSARRRAK